MEQVPRFASTSASGPKWGEARRRLGDSQSAGGARWAGGGSLTEFYSVARLWTPPTSSLQRNVEQSLGFVLVFSFFAICQVPGPRAGRTHSPARSGPCGQVRAWSTLPPPTRQEPTCLYPLTEPLRFGLAQGQLYSHHPGLLTPFLTQKTSKEGKGLGMVNIVLFHMHTQFQKHPKPHAFRGNLF